MTDACSKCTYVPIYIELEMSVANKCNSVGNSRFFGLIDLVDVKVFFSFINFVTLLDFGYAYTDIYISFSIRPSMLFSDA